MDKNEHRHIYERGPNYAKNWTECIKCNRPYQGPTGVDLINERTILLEVIQEFQELIASSNGVAGLHLNGDLAVWDELLNGPFQWLGALAALPERLKRE